MHPVQIAYISCTYRCTRLGRLTRRAGRSVDERLILAPRQNDLMGERDEARRILSPEAAAIRLARQSRDQVGRDVCERGSVTDGFGGLSGLLLCHDAPRQSCPGPTYRKGGHNREGNLASLFPQ